MRNERSFFARYRRVLLVVGMDCGYCPASNAARP